MIQARKSAWFSRWFAGYAERRVRRSFSEVRIHGLETARSALAQGPVLVVSNHTAWWDPLVILVLCDRVLRCDAYAMMDAANLRKLPFFANVGAFGVAMDDPRDGARAIRYAAKRLDGPRKLVWIFAQGREVPVTKRPLDFRLGSAEVARVAKSASVLPVGLRYEQGRTPEPNIWISVGPGVRPPARSRDMGEAGRDQEAAVTAELDRIERAVVDPRSDDFEFLFRKRASVWARTAEAMLALATRPRGLR